MLENDFEKGKDIDPESLAFRVTRYLVGLVREYYEPDNSEKFTAIFFASIIPAVNLPEEVYDTYEVEIARVNSLMEEGRVADVGIALTGMATSLFHYYPQEDLREIEKILEEQNPSIDDDYLDEISINN